MARDKQETDGKNYKWFIKNLPKVKKIWLIAFLSFAAGVLLVLVIRFALYKPAQEVHYHANFAVYINAQRETFKGPIYYQETTACAVVEKMTPDERVHMHDNVNDVLHVHDRAVTWGDFFTNLGWYVGPNFIETLDKLYVNDDASKVSIVLNGQDLTGITGIANKIIGDRDRLLVSYGEENTAKVQNEYKSVASTAKQEDESKDPASCGGQAQDNFKTRFKNLF